MLENARIIVKDPMAKLSLCLSCAAVASVEAIDVWRCARCPRVFCIHGIRWPRRGFELCHGCAQRAPRVPEDIDQNGRIRVVPLTQPEAEREIAQLRAEQG